MLDNSLDISINNDITENVSDKQKELERIRLEKRNKITETYFFKPEIFPSQLINLKEGDKTSSAGRVIFLRDLGGIAFIKISDIDGVCQVVLSEKVLKDFNTCKTSLDLGDVIGIKGDVIRTNSGEISIQATELYLLSKCLKSWPDKWSGITDNDLKLRQRYLGLILDNEIKDTFKIRHKVIKSIRNILDEHDFIEVETPILQNIASGAAALPFSTHHNALDKDFYLRIAPELFLKQLIIGGYKRVYELGRCFRNEGIDPTHLQEFTMLEFYHTYINYEDFKDFCVNFVRQIVYRVFGSYEANGYNFEQVSKISYKEFMLKNLNIDIEKNATREDLIKYANEHKLDINQYPTYESLREKLYKVVAQKIVQPVLIYDYPSHPLAKYHEDDPKTGYLFQLVVGGFELIKCYMELNDSIVLNTNLSKEEGLRDSGEQEFVRRDPVFETAMAYGMPVTGGFGMGIDRLIMILTKRENIRQTVFFPMYI